MSGTVNAMTPARQVRMLVCEDVLRMLVQDMITKSMWFVVEPLPNGQFALYYKSEAHPQMLFLHGAAQASSESE